MQLDLFRRARDKAPEGKIYAMSEVLALARAKKVARGRRAAARHLPAVARRPTISRALGNDRDGAEGPR